MDIRDHIEQIIKKIFECPECHGEGPLPAEDAITVMVQGGETLYNKTGDAYIWNKKNSCFERYLSGREHILKPVGPFDDLYRRSEKRKRLQTPEEAKAWAESDESLGWMIGYKYILDKARWVFPRMFVFDNRMDLYKRVRLLPDMSGIDESTICGFEVEE